MTDRYEKALELFDAVFAIDKQIRAVVKTHRTWAEAKSGMFALATELKGPETVTALCAFMVENFGTKVINQSAIEMKHLSIDTFKTADELREKSDEYVTMYVITSVAVKTRVWLWAPDEFNAGVKPYTDSVLERN